MLQVEAPPRARAARRDLALYALVRVHGHLVAIPGECVTQAVATPSEWAHVPRRAGAIEGVMTIGRAVVPVIGLGRWLEPAAGAEPAQAAGIAQGRVLLLQHGGTRVGLAVEAVVGTQRVPRDQVRRLFHDDHPDELFQSAVLFGDDRLPTSILEPDRLMALAGVWVAEAALDVGDAPEAEVSDARVASHTDAVGWATFRVADAWVALPAANVGELLRLPPLRRELPQRDGVLGLCEWRGRLVPVVDLAGALHALPASDAATWLCIVCEGDLAIGLVLHEVLEIARIAPDAGTPEFAPADERPVVGRRLVKDGGTLQLLDMALLLHRYAEAAISAKGARAATARTRIDPTAPAYMVFDAGGMFAAPIDGVQEVVALPDDLRERVGAGHPATLQWREQAVPVTAIGDDLVALPAQAARQLLVIRRDDRLAALPIVGVKAMVPRGIAQRSRMRLRGRPVEVISVETDDHRATYPVVDLHTPR